MDLDDRKIWGISNNNMPSALRPFETVSVIFSSVAAPVNLILIFETYDFNLQQTSQDASSSTTSGSI